MLTLGIALVALFGLCVIVSVLARADGREFDAPVRDYSEPRI